MTSLIRIIRRTCNEWRDASSRPVMRKPTVLQFPVNDICNSRCQMCRIWERKRDEEISVEQLAHALEDPLFSEIENVGLNGGEPTLRPDLVLLAETLIRRLPRLKAFSLITNAIREKHVIAAVEGLGQLCQEHGKHLDVMVSLDGVGDVHDRVRGVSGNFETAMRVLDYLRQSTVVNSCRIGCTIIGENAFDLENVLALARHRGVYARFRLGIPHPRLYSAHLSTPFFLDANAVFHVAAFLDTLIQEYEQDEGRRAFYISLRNQVSDGRPRTAGCAWRSHGATLGPRGELSYCAVASPVLGNVRNTSALGLYWGNKAVLEEIVREKCAGCRHDYEGIGQRSVLMRHWSKRALRRLPVPMWRLLRGSWRMLRDWKHYWSPVKLSGKDADRQSAGTVRVLLGGWYGTETLGDKAILAAVCQLIRETFPRAIIDVASLHPYVTRETCRLMPEMGVCDVLDLPAATAAVSRGHYQAVGIAGGPLMTPVREVIDLKRLLMTARRAGARTALIGCGLGPIVNGGARHAAIGWMVRNVDACLLRDRASVELAHKHFKRTKPAVHAADPAFFWSDIECGGAIGRPQNSIVVALALRDWSIEEYALGLPAPEAVTLKERFEVELGRMVDGLRSASSAVTIVPVCMHTLALGGDDRWFYRRLFTSHPDLQSLVPWRRRSPREELSQLARADGIIAMRFHSVVFSLALGKPFLALDYTLGGKVAALLSDTHNEHRMIALNSFDGAVAARRILDDISCGRSPAKMNLRSARNTYLETMHQFLGARGPLS